ncbi:RNAse H family protein [[Clostridium] sordellii]|uniref:ribonuclease H n=1 Tax=Paraclostridium sordellii TaxID=1505 RepID=A0ABM9RLU2_PARSO|nr:ribonuclease H family protein [Paeniclostridium sordellii]TAN67834.1 RNase H [Paeniclostridium sordellii 8483]CEJ72987.1 putative ribonuclease [[Clostridium] sordellii] [Paeniclostridium sordellii]CEK30682.1 RNAse H family protein [[Clostridium] sordellii] [Paeniclostridium sordellii]CEN68540.1 RNAse H family protein [[Clostridium] sordellii] [Paeniclostridium sordellii]CEN71807.1 RNAse H family protein [[Clostridium] sordellii] [Paeniclostridium sordellii]
MSNKYYAVKVGKKPGIYKTWDECKEQVNKFPGAIYKSFKTLEEAEKFSGVKTSFNENKNNKLNNSAKKADIKKEGDLKPIRSSANVKYFEKYIEPETIKDDFDFIAFVDGSYDRVSKTFGSGIAVLDLKNDTIEEFKVAGNDKWDQWNIVGEIEASKFAIKLGYEKELKKICIYHDLKNIALWASGSWQAKNEYTQDYVRYVEKYSENMEITFIKVKGHSCNKYNDIADRLAREAIEEYLYRR